MRSFRLDRESFGALFDWAWLVAIPAGLAVGWLGASRSAGQWILAAVGVALYLWLLLRGTIAAQLRERYPTARSRGLLLAGLTILVLGGATHGMRGWQPTWAVWMWVLPGAGAVIAFLVRNRGNEEVMQ